MVIHQRVNKLIVISGVFYEVAYVYIYERILGES